MAFLLIFFCFKQTNCLDAKDALQAAKPSILQQVVNRLQTKVSLKKILLKYILS